MANLNKCYSTADTALAAYLQSEGFTRLQTTTRPNPRAKDGYDAVFQFQDDPNMLHCVRLWHTGQAEGNLLIFFTNHRKLVREAKKAVEMARL